MAAAGGVDGSGDRLVALGVAPDVDAPARELRRQARVLPAAADGEREHPLRDRDVGDAVLLVDEDPVDLGGREGLGDEDRRVFVPLDDVDLLAGELGHDGLDPSPALAHGRAHRVQALLARCDGDLAPAARVPRDRLDLDGAGVDLGYFQLEQATQEALVGPAHQDLGTLGRATHLEDEGLHVLADPVVLDRGLLGRGQDGLGLAEVEDDRPRLDAVDGPGDEVALAAGELVEDDVALGLTEALEHDLLGGLGADAAEGVLPELLRHHDVAGDRRRP